MSGPATCPYNPEHRMPADRLQWHLTKGCRDQQRLAHLYSICPYNGLHHILTPKIHDHMLKCPDRNTESKRMDDLSKVLASAGPADDSWASSWPEDKQNLNRQYVPAPAKNKPLQPQAVSDIANFNVMAPSVPVAVNPYIGSSQPNKSVGNFDPGEDVWVTQETKKKKREQGAGNEWRQQEEPSLAEQQMMMMKVAGKKKHGRGKAK